MATRFNYTRNTFARNNIIWLYIGIDLLHYIHKYTFVGNRQKKKNLNFRNFNVICQTYHKNVKKMKCQRETFQTN